MSSYDATFKIVLLGDSASKTTLLYRFLTNIYDESIHMTTGVDYCSKTLSLDDKKIKLQIWDFAGEERFRFLLHQYYKGARGGLFVFNISDSSSLAHIDDWLSAIRKGVGTEVSFPILVVGLLPDDENMRKVSTEEGVKIAKSRNLNGYIECSPKTGENVGKVFETLTRLILADNSKGRKKRELKKATRSQLLEKASKKGDMDRLLDDFQIPEEVKKEKQPRITDEDIMILDLESEEGIQLIKLFEEAIGVHATERGKETKLFIKWLKGEEVFVRKRFPRARGNVRGRDDDRYPYPYVFKPPEPPDDLALAPRVQLHASPKKKITEEKIHCQYCGRKLTKEEQLTHSCKKKPK